MDLSPGTLFASLLIGAVGFGLFLYGKKQARPPQLVCGVTLMIYPYFVDGVLLMTGIAVLVLAALWLAVRRGC